MEPMVIVGIVVGILALLFAGGIVIWAARLTRKGMRSEPVENATVVDRKTLQAMLLKLNQWRHPFQLHISDEADLEVKWDVVDAKWIEILGKASEHLKYRAWIVLDDEAKTVKYHERIYGASFTAGGPEITATSYSAHGFESWGKRSGRRWGIGDDFSVGEIYDYRFNPGDVKDVVRQIANDHGWAFELKLTKPAAPIRATPASACAP